MISSCPKVNPVLNGAPASITPNEFLAGLNADNKNEWVTVVMLSHVYALKVCGDVLTTESQQWILG